MDLCIWKRDLNLAVSKTKYWLWLERKQRKCRECTLHFSENLAFAAHHLPASYGTAVTWQRFDSQMSSSSGCLGSGCLFEMNSKTERVWGLPGATCTTRSRSRKGLLGDAVVLRIWHCFAPFCRIYSPHRAKSGRWNQSYQAKNKTGYKDLFDSYLSSGDEYRTNDLPAYFPKAALNTFRHSESWVRFPVIKHCSYSSLFKYIATCLLHCKFSVSRFKDRDNLFSAFLFYYPQQ